MGNFGPNGRQIDMDNGDILMMLDELDKCMFQGHIAFKPTGIDKALYLKIYKDRGVTVIILKRYISKKLSFNDETNIVIDRIFYATNPPAKSIINNIKITKSQGKITIGQLVNRNRITLKIPYIFDDKFRDQIIELFNTEIVNIIEVDEFTELSLNTLLAISPLPIKSARKAIPLN